MVKNHELIGPLVEVLDLAKPELAQSIETTLTNLFRIYGKSDFVSLDDHQEKCLSRAMARTRNKQFFFSGLYFLANTRTLAGLKSFEDAMHLSPYLLRLSVDSGHKYAAPFIEAVNIASREFSA